MIQGLHIEMPTAKLAEHLMARSTYHAKRREHYLAEYKRTTEQDIVGEEEMDADEGFTNTANYGGRQSALQSAKSHRVKAAYFKFIAENLIQDEIYRLSEADLGKYELALVVMG